MNTEMRAALDAAGYEIVDPQPTLYAVGMVVLNRTLAGQSVVRIHENHSLAFDAIGVDDSLPVLYPQSSPPVTATGRTCAYRMLRRIGSATCGVGNGR